MDYRVFANVVRSEVPLPVQALGPGARPDIVIEWCRGDVAGLDRFAWIHEWASPAGTVVMQCARRGDEYLLRIPGLADYHVTWKPPRIGVYPRLDGPRDSAVQALLDQAIPRVLFHSGAVVVHASAVVLRNGAAIALVGETGRGKSTLAASFCASGATLLSDDALLLEAGDGQLVGIPAYPTMRLWPDSFDGLRAGALGGSHRDLSSGKKALYLKSSAFRVGPVDLSAVFVLGDIAAGAASDPVRCKRLHGQAALMAMIRASFALDVVSPDVAPGNFDRLARIVRQETPLYTLDFSRRFDLLPQVRARIRDIVATAGLPPRRAQG